MCMLPQIRLDLSRLLCYNSLVEYHEAIDMKGVLYIMELQKITYFSSLDSSMQPALVCAAEGEEKRPLAVCLHTWSYDISRFYEDYLAKCQERNWHFIYDQFAI